MIMCEVKKLNPQIKDVIGEVYNRFTIIENLPSIKYGKTSYKRVKAVCECGNTRELCYRDLKRENTKSCGCIANEIKTKVVSGDTFGLWIILEETKGYFYKGIKTDRAFICKCICGKEKEVNLQSLKKGDSKSCGCKGIIYKEKIIKTKLIPEDTVTEQWKESVSYIGYYISSLGRFFNYNTQYMFPISNSYIIKGASFLGIQEMYKTFIGDYNSYTHSVIVKSEERCLKNIELKSNKTIEEERTLLKRLHSVYGNIKTRCNNPKTKDYKNYGGRGIMLEESLNTFSKFLKFMIDNGYTYDCKLEIDRQDNDGNYSVVNCRLISKADNNRNMRRNVITWEIVEDIRSGKYVGMSNKDIAEAVGCCRGTVTTIRSNKTWVT